MDGFTYTNIFDTKGIEYLIIIAFLIMLIPFWVILNRQVKITRTLQKALGNLSANILRIPQGLFYNKNHTWAHLQSSGIAKVGLDDLLLHLTGAVKFNKLRKQGDFISKGDLLVEIDQSGKMLEVFSPISGQIIQTNVKLNQDPELLYDDLYNNCWIYKIMPVNWVEETNSCFLAKTATDWSAKELERFKDFLAVSMEKHSQDTSKVILQDGGVLCDNVLSELPKEIWQDFQNEFLNQ
jgi:glycine cleavage system H protein